MQSEQQRDMRNVKMADERGATSSGCSSSEQEARVPIVLRCARCAIGRLLERALRDGSGGRAHSGVWMQKH